MVQNGSHSIEHTCFKSEWDAKFRRVTGNMNDSLVQWVRASAAQTEDRGFQPHPCRNFSLYFCNETVIGVTRLDHTRERNFSLRNITISVCVGSKWILLYVLRFVFLKHRKGLRMQLFTILNVSTKLHLGNMKNIEWKISTRVGFEPMIFGRWPLSYSSIQILLTRRISFIWFWGYIPFFINIPTIFPL